MRIVCFLFVFLFTFSAFGEFSSQDRLKALYGTRIQFNSEGIPIIRVGIVEDAKQVEFSTKGKITIFSAELGGLELVMNGKHTFRAKIHNGKKANFRYFPALASFKPNDMENLNNIKNKIELTGIKTKVIERGRVFGFQGTLFDNREFLLIENKAYVSAKKAKQRGENLHVENIITAFKPAVYSEIVTYPKGVVTIEADTGEILRSKSVISFKPEKNKTILIKNVEFGKGFSWHGYQTRFYHDIIYITINKHGRIAVGNLLDAESLLKGILPSEIYITSPIESLKAQAVAARIELLSKIGLRHNTDPYQVCADVHCQVYKGVVKTNKFVVKAIKETTGQLLFYDNGQLIDAYYNSSCGGFTEKPENVWKNVKPSRFKCVFDGIKLPKLFSSGINNSNIKAWITSPPKIFDSMQNFSKTVFRWKKTVSKKKIKKRLEKHFHKNFKSNIVNIKVNKRGCSGRASEISVLFKNGSELIVKYELTIRRVLGGLRSSMFFIKNKKKSFEFIGGGFGHGIGMCQTGAIGRAKSGQTFQQILNAYYPGAKLRKIYPALIKPK